MLNRPEEYQKMSTVESKLWWYRSLHELVIREIREHFGDRRDLSILDAGCGTGGLMIAIGREGYSPISGFDLSEYAIRFCRDKGLDVKCLDIKTLDLHYPSQSFDIIVSNDVLYFLDDEERKEIFPKLKTLLKPGGIFISNVPALEAFRGMHDISVGIRRRFTRQSFLQAISPTDFEVRKTYFWPFLLSPIVYLTRLAQRVSLYINKEKKIESDVELPSAAVNRLLYSITATENRLLSWKPFGSSLFVTLKRK